MRFAAPKKQRLGIVLVHQALPLMLLVLLVCVSAILLLSFTIEPPLPLHKDQELYKHGDGDGVVAATANQQANESKPRIASFSKRVLCFVTSEFSETLQEADVVPSVDPSMRTDPPRHFLFTNQPQLKGKHDGWEPILMTDQDLPFQRLITKSRWPKFLGWKHDKLQHCQIIFYGDAYLLNPVNETAWQYMAQLVSTSSVGLMQATQIGANRKPVNGPITELKKNARFGKVSWETANYTIAWLKSQPDFKNNKRQGQTTLVYKNALFGYDPHNPRFTTMVEDFWKEYSQEKGSWRDQPYWAYFLSKHGITPLPFPFVPPIGPQGMPGHNGHIYVKQFQQQQQQQQQPPPVVKKP
jgi:hypothetical protein